MAAVNLTPPVITQQLLNRFWANVDKNGPIPTRHPELGPCWLWTGECRPNGYGVLRFSLQGRRKTVATHRLSYQIACGPPSQQVLHHCDNPPCCRPTHLFDGSQKDNRADSAQKERTATGDKNGSRLYPEKLKRGESHALTTLTANDVREIRRYYLTGVATLKRIAGEYKVSLGTVHNIVHRKTWGHVT